MGWPMTLWTTTAWCILLPILRGTQFQFNLLVNSNIMLSHSWLPTSTTKKWSESISVGLDCWVTLNMDNQCSRVTESIKCWWIWSIEMVKGITFLFTWYIPLTTPNRVLELEISSNIASQKAHKLSWRQVLISWNCSTEPNWLISVLGLLICW